MRQRIYRVVIAEDEPIILRSIAAKIEKADANFRVVAMAVNGEEALKYVLELKPDLLVTDIIMPRMDGMALIRS